MSRKLTAINFPKPVWAEIEKRANIKSLERGMSLFNSGQVKSVNIKKRAVTASVGRGKYETEISWDDKYKNWDF